MAGSLKFFTAHNPALAAALATCGVPFLEGDGCSKVISTAGTEVGFNFEPESKTGIPTNGLEKAFDDEESAAQVLDDAISNLDIPDAQKRELLNLAHYAAMSYIRVAFDNRDKMEHAAGKSDGMLKITKGERFALMHKNASQLMREQIVAKFG